MRASPLASTIDLLQKSSSHRATADIGQMQNRLTQMVSGYFRIFAKGLIRERGRSHYKCKTEMLPIDRLLFYFNPLGLRLLIPPKTSSPTPYSPDGLGRNRYAIKSPTITSLKSTVLGNNSFFWCRLFR